jgi:exo-beta-1,3-glucanase (GH17 family)
VTPLVGPRINPALPEYSRFCEDPRMKTWFLILLLLCAMAGCSRGYHQPPDALVEGHVMALAYSGYRAGQAPGGEQPTREQVLEDLRILSGAGFSLIRTYGTGQHARDVLELIAGHDLPIQVLQGIWLSAELSNHGGCAWLTEPIPEEVLEANRAVNEEEVARGIALANEFADVIVAVNVGNEALVDWNDHMMPVGRVIAFVRQVREAIAQPVTVAENYVWWINDGADLAAELDFIGVHSYPVWEEKTIDEGLAYTIENVEAVRAALPHSRIAVLEAGWATTATEFGGRAGEVQQQRYYTELRDWASRTNTTVFWFEAFDEPWKGDPGNPLGAEKHWGLWFEDRTPKQVMQ